MGPPSEQPNCQEMMGQWCDITREEFIQEIANRIQNKPQCFYSSGPDYLNIETFGWDPPWVWPYAEGDGLVFGFKNLDGTFLKLYDIILVQVSNSIYGPPLWEDTPCP